jgi:hypothetical protein
MWRLLPELRERVWCELGLNAMLGMLLVNRWILEEISASLAWHSQLVAATELRRQTPGVLSLPGPYSAGCPLRLEIRLVFVVSFSQCPLRQIASLVPHGAMGLVQRLARNIAAIRQDVSQNYCLLMRAARGNMETRMLHRLVFFALRSRQPLIRRCSVLVQSCHQLAEHLFELIATGRDREIATESSTGPEGAQRTVQTIARLARRFRFLTRNLACARLMLAG